MTAEKVYNVPANTQCLAATHQCSRENIDVHRNTSSGNADFHSYVHTSDGIERRHKRDLKVALVDAECHLQKLVAQASKVRSLAILS